MTKFFYAACLVSGLMQAFLCYALLTDPQGMIGSFGIETNGSVAFVARRAAILFLGLSALSFAGLLLKYQKRMVAFALSTPWLGMACLGLFEHLRGTVGSEIYPAMAIETAIGLVLVAAALLTDLEPRRASSD